MTSRLPKPVSAHAGTTMKKLRMATGLSQAAFGAPMGRDKHQMAKYEAGTLQVSAPLLILATITADKIARAEYFKKVDEAMRAAKKE